MEKPFLVESSSDVTHLYKRQHPEQYPKKACEAKDETTPVYFGTAKPVSDASVEDLRSLSREICDECLRSEGLKHLMNTSGES